MDTEAGSGASSGSGQPALPDNFTKRAYQDELVARAVKENIVCALGTGTGKTYIAVKVIQELQEEVAKKWEEGGMRTVFVVPSVPLVEQQSKVLRQMTGLTTGAYHGGAGVDEWTRQKWEVEFRKHKILVMVHDIFKMLLSNAILEPKRLNLIIIDECHHASEKHPYREIMRLLHGDTSSHKPRILGLTASVINIKLDKKAGPFPKPSQNTNPNQQGKTTQEKLEAKIRDLEQCMGCVVWTSMDESLEVYGKRAAPVVVPYDTMAVTEDLDDLREGLDSVIDWIKNAVEKPKPSRHVAVDDWDELDEVEVMPVQSLRLVPLGNSSTLKEIKNHLSQVQNTLTSLGPWCAYKTSALLLEDLLHMRTLGIFLRETIAPVHASISTLQVFGSQLEVDFGVNEVTAQNSEGIWDLISPKAKRLIDLLDQFSSNGEREDFCCIVFVKERYNAWALHSLLQLIGSSKSSKRHSYISSGFCVGQLTESGAVESSGDKPHLSLKQLRNTLDLFREGSINVLVSTDVVEEGFDVRECNLIIRFDQPSNYRSYVQSRGRARAENSQFIMMIESRLRTKFETTDLREFQELDEVMKRHCYDRSTPTDEDRAKHFDDVEYPPFRPPNSKAVISMDTALITLQRYCNTLPNDNMTSCLVYMEEEKLGRDQYICTAHLPRSAAIKEPITSPSMKSKASAKKVAALLCCKALFHAGELDPVNLLPWPKDHWRQQAKDFINGYEAEVHEEGKPRAGTKKRTQIYPKQVPACFTPVPYAAKAVRFLYKIRLAWTGKIHDDPQRFEYDPTVVLGLITRNFLPTISSFPLYIGMRQYTVDFCLLQPIELDDDQLGQVGEFHTVVFEDILQLEGLLPLDRSQYDTLFVVPLKDNTVDWATVSELGQKDKFTVWNDKGKLRSIRAEEYVDRVVVTTYQGETFRQYVMQVRQDLTPSTPQQEENGGAALTHEEHIKIKFGFQLQHDQQPMLALRYCSKGLNFLKPKPEDCKDKSEETTKKARPGFTAEGWTLVAAELCQVLPVTSALYFKLRLLPSILHRLHSLANVASLYERLRRETGIGKNVTPPSQWQPFPEAYPGLYDHPVKATLEHSVKRLALDSNATLHIRAQTPPEEYKENSTVDSSVKLERGFLFGDYTQMSFYKAQQKRKQQRAFAEFNQFNQPINNTWPVVLPVVTKPLPPGCHSRLVDPPFFLDAEFLLNSASQSFPEVTDLLTALTLKGAGDEVNLERLETMGDAFLKMTTCVYLFLKFPAFHEGRLSALKGEQVSNQRLYRLAREKGLQSFIVGQVLEPTTMFLPPGFTTDQEAKKATANEKNGDEKNKRNSLNEMSDDSLSGNERNSLNEMMVDEQGSCSDGSVPENDWNRPNSVVSPQPDLRVNQAINDKCLADVMEALIGVVLVKCGSGSAMHFMDWLGVKVLPENGVQIGSGDVSTVPNPLLRNDPEMIQYLRQFQKSFLDFEERIGYKFRQPAFLLEAFTHNSFYSNRFTDCYQRLEFIGDAILDFLITRYLYEEKPVDGNAMDPGRLTDLRSALVNNKTFSLLAAKHNFHTNIKFHSPKIFSQIRMYVEEAQKMDPSVVGLSDDMLNMDPNDDDDENEEQEGYEEAEDPKTLGDVFESVAGAIFLDSGFSLDAVWKVYWNLMKERIEYCVKQCPKNPVRVLLEENSRAVDFQKATILSNQKVQIQVSVRKNGETLVFTGIGNNHRTAKCAAAKEALKQLGSTTITS